jgi:hypothetical protein
MTTPRKAIGYSLHEYTDVIELTGNHAITCAGYSFQKISKCLNGKKLSTGGRVWSLLLLSFSQWKVKVDAAVNNKRHEIKVTEDEVVTRLKDRKLSLVRGTYFGTKKKAFFDCIGNPSHRWEATPDHIFQGQGCPTCAGNQPLLVEDVHAVGLLSSWVLLNDSFQGIKTPAKWFCLVHNKAFSKLPEKIIYRNSGCVVCGRERIAASRKRSLEEIRQILQSRSVDLLNPESYVGTNEITNFVCLQDSSHISWRTSTQHLIAVNEPTGCPTCSGKKPVSLEDISNRLRSKNIEIIKSSFMGGMQSQATFKCLAGKGHANWTTAINNVYATHISSGCPACAERGYNPSLPGCFYLIKIYNQEFGDVFGFGITNQWSRRWQTHKKNLSYSAFTWDEPTVFEFESGYQCRSLETSVKKFLKMESKKINLNIEGFINEAGLGSAYEHVLRLAIAVSE